MRARDFSSQPRSSRSGLGLNLAGALALALAAQQAIAARVELGRVEARVAEARRELEVLRQRSKGTAHSAAPAQVALARAMAASAAPPSLVLHDMVALMPSGVRFDGLELTYGPEIEVQVRVVALQVADFDEFMERLALSSRFDLVEPGPEVREGEMRASLRAVYRSGPRP
jgi:hypothetical protein